MLRQKGFHRLGRFVSRKKRYVPERLHQRLFQLSVHAAEERPTGPLAVSCLRLRTSLRDEPLGSHTGRAAVAAAGLGILAKCCEHMQKTQADIDVANAMVLHLNLQ